MLHDNTRISQMQFNRGCLHDNSSLENAKGVTEAIENAVAYTRPVGGAGILLGQYYSQTLQINAFFCS